MTARDEGDGINTGRISRRAPRQGGVINNSTSDYAQLGQGASWVSWGRV